MLSVHWATSHWLQPSIREEVPCLDLGICFAGCVFCRLCLHHFFEVIGGAPTIILKKGGGGGCGEGIKS